MLGIKYLNSNNNTEISIENKDIKKYLNDGYNNQKNMKLKKRISGNYGEILEIAQIDPSKSQLNYKGTNRGKQGFDYYDVNLAYPVKDNNGNVINYKYYESRLVVRKDNNNNFAYDLDGFKEKKGAALDKTSLSIATGKPVSSSFSTNNVSQSNTNVNTSSIKYSMQKDTNNTQELDNSSFLYDNQGRTLTKEQQDYFKDSKVRTEKGNLKVMYHGSPNEFTKFNRNYSNPNSIYGDGLYFTSIKELATNHSKDNKLYEVYLNIVNPLKEGKNIITKEQIKKFINTIKFNKQFADFIFGKNATTNDMVDYLYDMKDDFSMLNIINGLSKNNLTKTIEKFNEINGTEYDGIITDREMVVFNPNQIKNVDNTNPTSNEDIKYSQQNDEWQEHLEKNYKATGTKEKLNNNKMLLNKINNHT